MEVGLREVCRSVRIGKILIQRVSFRVRFSGQMDCVCWSCHFTCWRQDEETAQPKLFYSKVRDIGGDRLFCLYDVDLDVSFFFLQFPQDIASRYVLLLDPMLGVYLILLSMIYQLVDELFFIVCVDLSYGRLSNESRGSADGTWCARGKNNLYQPCEIVFASSDTSNTH